MKGFRISHVMVILTKNGFIINGKDFELSTIVITTFEGFFVMTVNGFGRMWDISNMC